MAHMLGIKFGSLLVRRLDRQSALLPLSCAPLPLSSPSLMLLFSLSPPFPLRLSAVQIKTLTKPMANQIKKQAVNPGLIRQVRTTLHRLDKPSTRGRASAADSSTRHCSSPPPAQRLVQPSARLIAPDVCCAVLLPRRVCATVSSTTRWSLGCLCVWWVTPPNA